MKKVSCFFTCFLLTAAIFAAEADKEAITDIKEKQVYEKGTYTSDYEGTTPTVKKEEGLDFKVPEIRITGEIDTNILVTREMKSFEDIQNIKEILYEKDNINVPDYYLKSEEELSPQAMELMSTRDFVGKIKLSAGTYNDLLGDAILGKVFDEDNKLILRLWHENYYNNTNDRVVVDNLNRASCYYNTRYDFLDVLYNLKLKLNDYDNPYADNLFKNNLSTNNVTAGFNVETNIQEIKTNALFQYDYFAQSNDANNIFYKENRFTNNIGLEKDFVVGNERKVKTMLSIDYYIGDPCFTDGTHTNIFNISAFFKGIFHFEPIIFQGGIKFQDYNLIENYYRVSPYLNIDYDLTPAISAYIDFKPEMKTVDYINILGDTPFIAPNKNLIMPVENTSVKAGFNLNFFSLFFDLYYIYESISDNIYINEMPTMPHVFSLFNNDLDYNAFGVSLETLKIMNLSISADYEHRNILAIDTPRETYFPENKADAKIILEKSEWNFTLACNGFTAQYGTLNAIIPAYCVIDFSVSRKINDILTVSGYINNLLNNNYYMLYYYNEKGLNLGIGVIFNF